jgi:hypothetical protein
LPVSTAKKRVVTNFFIQYFSPVSHLLGKMTQEVIRFVDDLAKKLQLQ